MRTRIDFIADARMPDVRETIGSDVELVWTGFVVPAGQTPAPDLVDGLPPGTPTPKREKVKAFLYFVSATTQVRQFAEIRAGDCIAAFAPELDLKNRNSLRFLIKGEEWSSRPVSEELSRYWCMAANLTLHQVALLRKGT